MKPEQIAKNESITQTTPEHPNLPGIKQEVDDAMVEGNSTIDQAKSQYGAKEIEAEMIKQGAKEKLTNLWDKTKRKLGLSVAGLAAFTATEAVDLNKAEATPTTGTEQGYTQEKLININAAKKLAFADNPTQVQKILHQYILEKTGKVSGQLSSDELAKELNELKATTLEMGGNNASIGIEIIDTTIKNNTNSIKQTDEKTKATAEVSSTPEGDELIKQLLEFKDNPKITNLHQQKTLKERGALTLIRHFVLAQAGSKNLERIPTHDEMHTHLPKLAASLKNIHLTEEQQKIPTISTLLSQINSYK
ncbi:MAG: hypothetical protein WCK11_04765 [Candidatus Falkowbacteria bacterium]